MSNDYDDDVCGDLAFSPFCADAYLQVQRKKSAVEYATPNFPKPVQ